MQRFMENHVSVQPIGATKEAAMTAELLTECFEKTNTGIRVIESQTRVNALNKTMNLLYKALEQYRKAPSGHVLRTLRGMLSRSYRFSGFTRTYVREHLQDYPGLSVLVS